MRRRTRNREGTGLCLLVMLVDFRGELLGVPELTGQFLRQESHAAKICLRGQGVHPGNESSASLFSTEEANPLFLLVVMAGAAIGHPLVAVPPAPAELRHRPVLEAAVTETLLSVSLDGGHGESFTWGYGGTLVILSDQ